MKAAAGSTPLLRRMWVRVAASVSTERLRPGMTGRVIRVRVVAVSEVGATSGPSRRLRDQRVKAHAG